MWSKIGTWIIGNKILAATFAIVSLVAISSVANGWSIRSAASRYLDLAKGWAKAYDRDIAATRKKHEAEMKIVTEDRDEYKRKWEEEKGKMNAPWKPPANAKALQKRFNQLGYRGSLR